MKTTTAMVMPAILMAGSLFASPALAQDFAPSRPIMRGVLREAGVAVAAQ
jgi:hypothetical protein